MSLTRIEVSDLLLTFLCRKLRERLADVPQRAAPTREALLGVVQHRLFVSEDALSEDFLDKTKLVEEADAGLRSKLPEGMEVDLRDAEVRAVSVPHLRGFYFVFILPVLRPIPEFPLKKEETA